MKVDQSVLNKATVVMGNGTVIRHGQGGVVLLSMYGDPIAWLSEVSDNKCVDAFVTPLNGKVIPPTPDSPDIAEITFDRSKNTIEAALVLPDNRVIGMSVRQDFSILQMIIGGYIETVSCKDHVIIVDEDGLRKSLPVNVLGSALSLRRIVGPAIIVGKGFTSIPEKITSMLRTIHR